ncbi:MAG TPA: hypothetical protein DCY88_07770 [Cyanobacteria bacterium UBA11372]|nr:hypothetical protein [Cyanobacteria bacterium UBA11372]
MADLGDINIGVGLDTSALDSGIKNLGQKFQGVKDVNVSAGFDGREFEREFRKFRDRYRDPGSFDVRATLRFNNQQLATAKRYVEKELQSVFGSVQKNYSVQIDTKKLDKLETIAEKAVLGVFSKASKEASHLGKTLKNTLAEADSRIDQILASSILQAVQAFRNEMRSGLNFDSFKVVERNHSFTGTSDRSSSLDLKPIDNSIKKVEDAVKKSKPKEKGALGSLFEGAVLGFGQNITRKFSSGFVAAIEKTLNFDTGDLGRKIGLGVGKFGDRAKKLLSGFGSNLIDQSGLTDALSDVREVLAESAVAALDESLTASELVSNLAKRFAASLSTISPSLEKAGQALASPNTYLNAAGVTAKPNQSVLQAPVVQEISRTVAPILNSFLEKRRATLLQDKGLPLVIERAQEIYEESLKEIGSLTPEAIQKGIAKAEKLKGRKLRNPDTGAEVDASMLAMGKLVGVNAPVAVTPETKELIITIGGYAGAQGAASGLRIAGDLAYEFSKMARREVAAIGLKNPDTDLKPEAMKHFATKAQGLLGSLVKPNLRGYNKDAVEMAAQAIAALIVNPGLKVKLLGESGGGFVAEEAAHLLNLAGFGEQIESAAFGTPNFIGGVNPKNHIKFLAKDPAETLGYETHQVYAPMGLADVSKPEQNLTGATGHPYEHYRPMPEFQKFAFNKEVAPQKASKGITQEDLNAVKKYIESYANLPGETAKEVRANLAQVLGQLKSVERPPELSAVIESLAKDFEDLLTFPDLDKIVQYRGVIKSAEKIVQDNLLKGTEEGKNNLFVISKEIGKIQIDLVKTGLKDKTGITKQIYNEFSKLKQSIGNLNISPQLIQLNTIVKIAEQKSTELIQSLSDSNVETVKTLIEELGLYANKFSQDIAKGEDKSLQVGIDQLNDIKDRLQVELSNLVVPQELLIPIDIKGATEKVYQEIQEAVQAQVKEQPIRIETEATPSLEPVVIELPSKKDIPAAELEPLRSTTPKFIEKEEEYLRSQIKKIQSDLRSLATAIKAGKSVAQDPEASSENALKVIQEIEKTLQSDKYSPSFKQAMGGYISQVKYWQEQLMPKKVDLSAASKVSESISERLQQLTKAQLQAIAKLGNIQFKSKETKEQLAQKLLSIEQTTLKDLLEQVAARQKTTQQHNRINDAINALTKGGGAAALGGAAILGTGKGASAATVGAGGVVAQAGGIAEMLALVGSPGAVLGLGGLGIAGAIGTAKMVGRNRQLKQFLEANDFGFLYKDVKEIPGILSQFFKNNIKKLKQFTLGQGSFPTTKASPEKLTKSPASQAEESSVLQNLLNPDDFVDKIIASTIKKQASILSANAQTLLNDVQNQLLSAERAEQESGEVLQTIQNTGAKIEKITKQLVSDADAKRSGSPGLSTEDVSRLNEDLAALEQVVLEQRSRLNQLEPKKDSRPSLAKALNYSQSALSEIDSILSKDVLADKDIARLKQLKDGVSEVFAEIGKPLPSNNFLTQFEFNRQKLIEGAGNLAKGFLAFQAVGAAMSLQNWFREISAGAVDVFVKFDNLSTALRYATGSAGAGASALKFVTEEVDRLRVPLLPAAEGFKQLAAATKGTQIEGQATRELFTGIAEAATVLGLSGEQVAGTINALAQMSSKGRIQLEELRAQLGDRIPGAMSLSARAMGVTESQLIKMIEAGQVASDDFLPRLGKQLRLQFGEAAKTASGNAQSAIFNFQNAVTKLQTNLGKALAPTAMVGMNALSAIIQSVAVHMDKLAIAVSAASAIFIAQAIPAIKTTLVSLISTSKILPLSAAEWIQAGLSVGKFAAQVALLSGVVLLVRGIADAVNSDLIQSFNNAAKSAQNAAKAAQEALNPKKAEGKPQDLPSVNWIDDLSRKYVNADGLTKFVVSAFSGFAPAIGEGINRGVNLLKTGKADYVSYADLQKQNLENAIAEIYGGGINVAASSKLSLAELKTGKGQFSELKQVEEELKKAEEGRRTLQARIYREYTNQGKVVPFEIQKELDASREQISQLNDRRATALQPLTTQITQIEQQIENTKNALRELNDPNTIAALGGEQVAAEQRQKLQASLDTLRRTKTEIDEAMSKGADPLQSLIREFKNLAYAIDEAERSAKNFGATQRAAIANAQLKNFATDPLAARTAQMAQLQTDRDAIKKSIESRNKALQDALKQVNDPSNAGLMAELNVSRDTSVTGLQRAIDTLPGGDENKGKKELLERMKSAKELEEQLLQDKASLAQQEVQIRQQAEQDALYAIQQSVAKQDAVIRQGENARVGFVKGQQKQRLATEEQVVESLARIQLDSSKKQLNSTEQELAAVRGKHKEGAISAEQFAQQERELLTKLSDQKRQIAENDLALQEAINRRRIANVEFANRQEEAAIEASQQKQINKIKARVASGKLSERQAQPLILKEQATGIGQQEEGARNQMRRDRILRSQNAIDDRELASRNAQNNQRLAQLEQQRQENRQQQNQQTLQDLEFTNKRAEALIEASQQRRINTVKQSQAKNTISERQAAEEITKIQSSAIASQIGETQKQIHQIKALQKQGKLSAEDSTTKQIELNQRLGQLNQQRIENEIQGNQQLIDSIEFINRLKQQEIELATAQANASIKGKQARGQLSDRQAQEQLTAAQRRDIASRLQSAEQQLSQVGSLPLSAESKKQRRLELRTQITQLRQQEAEANIQANQQIIQSLELANQRAEAGIEASQQRRINIVKKKQSEGLLSERQVAQETTKIQNATINSQIDRVKEQLAQNARIRSQGKLSSEEATTKQIELNQRLGQLNQQRIEGEIQANQQLVDSIEFVNGLRRQELELSNALVVASIKHRQARGQISERQSQFELNQAQRQDVARQIEQAQRELAQVGTLPKLSAEQRTTKQNEIKSRLVQLSQQEAEAVNQYNQLIVQDLEFANQRAESVIESSQQRRINIVKQKQSEGLLSERQVAQETNRIQQDNINSQIEQVKLQIAQNRELQSQGVRSQEDATTEEIKLNQRLGQLNQQRIEGEIQANQQLVDSIEFVNGLRRQEIELSNALAVAGIKERQARGQISERQAQSELNQAQRQDITRQLEQAQRELAQVDTLPKLSNEQRSTKRNELNSKIAQLSQQEADAIIQYNQQSVAAIEQANQRAEQAVELSQARRLNVVKQKQQEGALSERQAQAQVSQIQGDGIKEQILLIKKQIDDNKELKNNGVRSAEEAADKERELNLKLAQINGQRIDNEIQKIQQQRDAIAELINLKEAELELDTSKNQVALARKESDFLEAVGSISPLARLDLDRENLTLEQDRIRSQRQLTAQRLADIPRLKYSPDQEKRERLNLQKQLAQLDLQFEQNRGKLAENAFQKREKLLELGGSEIDLKGGQSETEFARKNLEALKSGQQIDQGRLKLQQDLARLQLARNGLLEKQADAERRLAAIPESDDARRIEAMKQLDTIQRQLYENEAESIRTNNQLAIAGIERRIEGREQESDLAAARARRRLAEQEASTLEGSGGLSDSIAQLQQERASLQAEQRALADQLQGTREKLAVLPQRQLGDRESAERNNLLKAEEDLLTRIAQNRSALAKNVASTRDRRQEIEMSRLQAEASQRELESGEKELAILRSGLPLNSELLKLDSDRNRLLSEREGLLLKQRTAEKLLADLPANIPQEIRFKRVVDVNEAKKAVQGNTRAILENEQSRKMKEKELEIAQIELEAQQRGIELQSQEVMLLRTGITFNQEVFRIEQERNTLLAERETLLIKQQRAASDAAKTSASTPEDLRIERQKALNEANKALYDNERSLIENNRKAAEAKANQQIADAKRTAEAAIASAEAEKSAQERVLKALDLQKGLIEARANLQKAVSDAGISDQEGKLEATSRALEAMKRLQDEENIDSRVRQALEAQIRGAGLQPGSNFEQGVLVKQQIEDELARRRIEARLQEEEIARRQLEIETKRNELTAKIGLMEAQITLQKAQQAEYEAKLNQAKEMASGDSDRIQQAEFQYAIAQQQRQQAEIGIQLANENLLAVRETADLERQRLTIQQQMVANQSKSAEKAREQAQALERAEVAAKGIAGASKSKSDGNGGSSGQSNGRFFIMGSKEDTMHREAMDSYSKVIQENKDAQSQQRNLLQLALGTQRNNPFFFEALQNFGMEHLAKLADKLRNVNPLEIARTQSNAMLNNQNVVSVLEELGDRIEKLANRPSVGSLHVSSPAPVNDSISIMRDINSSAMMNS